MIVDGLIFILCVTAYAVVYQQSNKPGTLWYRFWIWVLGGNRDEGGFEKYDINLILTIVQIILLIIIGVVAINSVRG